MLAEWLASLFKQRLGFGTAAKEDVEKVLEKPDFDSIVKFIQSDQCKNIITMAGAGISTCKYFCSSYLLYRCKLYVSVDIVS